MVIFIPIDVPPALFEETKAPNTQTFADVNITVAPHCPMPCNEGGGGVGSKQTQSGQSQP